MIEFDLKRIFILKFDLSVDLIKSNIKLLFFKRC